MVFYIIPTPIGNLNDLSPRAIATISSLDFLVVESFNITRKLLSRHSITPPKILIYNDQSKESDRIKICNLLKKGLCGAIVSDAGTPLISDPGYKLIKELVTIGVEIFSIPGPNAVISALVASGLPTDQFQFLGFFPRKDKEKIKCLNSIKNFTGTSILYDTPKRLVNNLEWLNSNSELNDFDICIAKEISKINESYFRGKASEIIELLKHNESFRKGEFVVLIKSNKHENDDLLVEELFHHFAKYVPNKELIQSVSKITGNPKNKIYKIFLTLSNRD